MEQCSLARNLRTSFVEMVLYIHKLLPASKGLAERAVQTFKQGIKRLREGMVETKLSRFLMKYRLTPHATSYWPFPS